MLENMLKDSDKNRLKNAIETSEKFSINIRKFFGIIGKSVVSKFILVIVSFIFIIVVFFMGLFLGGDFHNKQGTK